MRRSRLERNTTFTLDAQISQTDSGFVGALKLTDGTRTILERELTGSNCADLSNALALVSAVTLDGILPERPLAVTAPDPLDHPQSRSQAAQPRTSEEPKPPSAHLSFGGIVGMHQGIAPTIVPTVGLTATLRKRTLLGLTELRIEGLVGWSQWRAVFDSELRVGEARFAWVSARAEACPMQSPIGPTSIGACAIVEVGGLRGEGSTSRGNRSNWGGWLAPGLLLNWSGQAQALEFRVAGGAVRPTVRDNYQFAERPLVFRPPSLSFVGEFELAWAFQ